MKFEDDFINKLDYVKYERLINEIENIIYNQRNIYNNVSGRDNGFDGYIVEENIAICSYFNKKGIYDNVKKKIGSSDQQMRKIVEDLLKIGKYNIENGSITNSIKYFLVSAPPDLKTIINSKGNIDLSIYLKDKKPFVCKSKSLNDYLQKDGNTENVVNELRRISIQVIHLSSYKDYLKKHKSIIEEIIYKIKEYKIEGFDYHIQDNSIIKDVFDDNLFSKNENKGYFRDINESTEYSNLTKDNELLLFYEEYEVCDKLRNRQLASLFKLDELANDIGSYYLGYDITVNADIDNIKKIHKNNKCLNVLDRFKNAVEDNRLDGSSSGKEQLSNLHLGYVAKLGHTNDFTSILKFVLDWRK